MGKPSEVTGWTVGSLATTLVGGIGFGLLIGGGVRLAFDLLVPIAAELARSIPDRQLPVYAILFAVTLPILIGAGVCSWRLGRQFGPDIRALSGTPEPPTARTSRLRPGLALLGTIAAVALTSLAVLSGTPADVVAIAAGVGMRLAAIVGASLWAATTG